MIVDISVSSQNAIIPPRGWNSYDGFNWIVSEEEYLQNANIVLSGYLLMNTRYCIYWTTAIEL